MKHISEVLAILLIVALVDSGCATRALWEDRACHPADKPHLQLASCPGKQDVLVQYREQYSESKHFQNRAYWLFASTNQIAGRSKPVFVRPRFYAGLIPIPILSEMPTYHATSSNLVAVSASAEQGFDLWRSGESLGRFNLPVYLVSPRRTFWRLVATPFAALGDTTVILAGCAAVAAVVGGILYFGLNSDN
jgi:hypothetical protein